MLKAETDAIFSTPAPKKEEPPKNEPMSEAEKEGDKPAADADAEAEAPKEEVEAKKDDTDMNKEQ